MFSISKILFPCRSTHNFKRNIKSALYIVGEKAQRMFVPIHPQINEERLLNEEELLNNIKRRGINLDFGRFKRRYYFYKTIEEKKLILENTRDEINDLYESLLKDPNDNEDKIKQLKLHRYVVKEELKSLKEFLIDLQEDVMISILNIPNILHEFTPLTDQVFHEHLEKPHHQSESHVDIANKLNILKLVDNWGCYLKSEGSRFELGISNYFVEKLVEFNFIPFQNTDFTRSVIVEGVGKDVVGNEEVLTIHESNKKNEVMEELSRLHLTGSASTYAFMGYFTKNLVPHSHFPLKYFCYGRSYNGNIRQIKNLFSLNQESALNIFIASVDDDSFKHFETLTNHIVQLYDRLGWHYRLVYLSPEKLERNESLRLSIQMYSNHSQEYIEVGYLSYYGNYISERLLFCCKNKQEQIFPNIISGNILSVQKILGCVLENQEPLGKSILTELLCKYLP